MFSPSGSTAASNSHSPPAVSSMDSDLLEDHVHVGTASFLSDRVRLLSAYRVKAEPLSDGFSSGTGGAVPSMGNPSSPSDSNAARGSSTALTVNGDMTSAGKGASRACYMVQHLLMKPCSSSAR